MNIRLKPDTEEWLKAQVAEGRFESVEAAVETLVAVDRQEQERIDAMDLSWAKPYIDEGLAAIEAGELVPAEEVYADLRKRFPRPQGS